VNPIVADPRTEQWPIDPLGAGRSDLEAAAAAVRDRLTRGDGVPADRAGLPLDDRQGWRADVQTLLAEHASTPPSGSGGALPDALTVSGLVDLTADPQGLIRRLRRPLPQAPARHARRGTAFHAWVQRQFAGESLLDLDELPGSDDRDAVPDEMLPDLIAAFGASSWASRTPIAVEVPFSTVLGGMVVRGRIDAVFADPDGGVTIVDWKTGARPSGRDAEAAAVQLDAYRVAWSRLTGLPLPDVRAVFHYVATGETVAPPGLSGAKALDERIRDAVAELD
jgi:DNA helicase-2/ATP-dependent DNA helicase PcrA